MTGAGHGSDAARDLAAGLSRVWLWTGLAWNDIRQRYRGSLLGSCWITINIVLLVGTLTLIFAGPFGSDRQTYAAYVAVGLVVWYFIQGTLNDACQVFVGSAETIRHTSMPLSVHVLRLLCRNSIVLGHNALIIPIALIAFQIRPAAWAWTAVPGLLLLLFSTFWASLLLGLLGARFRDITQLVSNALQLLFFLTPIFWPLASLGPDRAWLLGLNPVFAYIDIIRSPLLGAAPSPASWPIALGVAALTAILAFFALSRLRRHVAYWV